MKKAIIFILWVSLSTSISAYGSECEESFTTSSRIADRFKQFLGISNFLPTGKGKPIFNRRLNDKQFEKQFSKLQTREEKFTLIETQLLYYKPTITLVVALAVLGGPRALQNLKDIIDNNKGKVPQSWVAEVIRLMKNPQEARELFNYVLENTDAKKDADIAQGLSLSAHKFGEEGVRVIIQSLRDHPMIWFRMHPVLRGDNMRELILKEFIDDTSLIAQDQLVGYAFEAKNRDVLEALSTRSDPLVKSKAQQALDALSNRGEFNGAITFEQIKNLAQLSANLQVKKAVIDRLAELNVFTPNILRVLSDSEINVQLYFIEKASQLGYYEFIISYFAKKNNGRLHQAIISSVLSNKDLDIRDLNFILEEVVFYNRFLARELAEKLIIERRLKLSQLSNKLQYALIDR